jgi:hypothetical protein
MEVGAPLLGEGWPGRQLRAIGFANKPRNSAEPFVVGDGGHLLAIG